MKKIAILGATGYVGKSLYPEILKVGGYEIFLYSRDEKKLNAMVQQSKISNNKIPTLRNLKDFGNDFYDVIINATGIGNTAQQREDLSLIFSLTEEIDNLILRYLFDNPKSVYLNFSSGAVFGTGFTEAVVDTTLSKININKLKRAEYYGVAKLNAEAKHRSYEHLSIVDLRVYAFFSSFVDTSAEFLMSEIVKCLKNKTTMKTNGIDIVRDYITPVDLWALIEKVLASEKPLNDVFDVYSKSTVTKFELLNSLSEEYELKYEIDDSAGIKSGFSKNIYYSENEKAKNIGYKPKLSSLEGIISEINKMYELELLKK